MKLKNYIKDSKISINDFAKTVGVHRMTIQKYIYEIRMPIATIMQKIYLATNGEVQPNDFYNLDSISPASCNQKEDIE